MQPEKRYKLFFHLTPLDSNGFYTAAYVGKAKGHIDTGVQVVSNTTGGLANPTGYVYAQKTAVFSVIDDNTVFVSTDGHRLTLQNKIGSNSLSFIQAFIEFVLQEPITEIVGDEYDGLQGKKAYLVDYKNTKGEKQKATLTNSWDSFWHGVGHGIEKGYDEVKSNFSRASSDWKKGDYGDAIGRGLLGTVETAGAAAGAVTGADMALAAATAVAAPLAATAAPLAVTGVNLAAATAATAASYAASLEPVAQEAAVDYETYKTAKGTYTLGKQFATQGWKGGWDDVGDDFKKMGTSFVDPYINTGKDFMSGNIKGGFENLGLATLNTGMAIGTVYSAGTGAMAFSAALEDLAAEGTVDAGEEAAEAGAETGETGSGETKTGEGDGGGKKVVKPKYTTAQRYAKALSEGLTKAAGGKTSKESKFENMAEQLANDGDDFVKTTTGDEEGGDFVKTTTGDQPKVFKYRLDARDFDDDPYARDPEEKSKLMRKDLTDPDKVQKIMKERIDQGHYYESKLTELKPNELKELNLKPEDYEKVGLRSRDPDRAQNLLDESKNPDYTPSEKKYLQDRAVRTINESKTMTNQEKVDALENLKKDNPELEDNYSYKRAVKDKTYRVANKGKMRSYLDTSNPLDTMKRYGEMAKEDIGETGKALYHTGAGMVTGGQKAISKASDILSDAHTSLFEDSGALERKAAVKNIMNDPTLTDTEKLDELDHLDASSYQRLKVTYSKDKRFQDNYTKLIKSTTETPTKKADRMLKIFKSSEGKAGYNKEFMDTYKDLLKSDEISNSDKQFHYSQLASLNKNAREQDNLVRLYHEQNIENIKNKSPEDRINYLMNQEYQYEDKAIAKMYRDAAFPDTEADKNTEFKVKELKQRIDPSQNNDDDLYDYDLHEKYLHHLKELREDEQPSRLLYSKPTGKKLERQELSQKYEDLAKENKANGDMRNSARASRIAKMYKNKSNDLDDIITRLKKYDWEPKNLTHEERDKLPDGGYKNQEKQMISRKNMGESFGFGDHLKIDDDPVTMRAKIMNSKTLDPADRLKVIEKVKKYAGLKANNAFKDFDFEDFKDRNGNSVIEDPEKIFEGTKPKDRNKIIQKFKDTISKEDNEGRHFLDELKKGKVPKKFKKNMTEKDIQDFIDKRDVPENVRNKIKDIQKEIQSGSRVGPQTDKDFKNFLDKKTNLSAQQRVASVKKYYRDVRNIDNPEDVDYYHRMTGNEKKYQPLVKEKNLRSEKRFLQTQQGRADQIIEQTGKILQDIKEEGRNPSLFQDFFRSPKTDDDYSILRSKSISESFKTGESVPPRTGTRDVLQSQPTVKSQLSTDEKIYSDESDAEKYYDTWENKAFIKAMDPGPRHKMFMMHVQGQDFTSDTKETLENISKTKNELETPSSTRLSEKIMQNDSEKHNLKFTKEPKQPSKSEDEDYIINHGLLHKRVCLNRNQERAMKNIGLEYERGQGYVIKDADGSIDRTKTDEFLDKYIERHPESYITKQQQNDLRTDNGQNEFINSFRQEENPSRAYLDHLRRMEETNKFKKGSFPDELQDKINEKFYKKYLHGKFVSDNSSDLQFIQETNMTNTEREVKSTDSYIRDNFKERDDGKLIHDTNELNDNLKRKVYDKYILKHPDILLDDDGKVKTKFDSPFEKHILKKSSFKYKVDDDSLNLKEANSYQRSVNLQEEINRTTDPMKKKELEEEFNELPKLVEKITGIMKQRESDSKLPEAYRSLFKKKPYVEKRLMNREAK